VIDTENRTEECRNADPVVDVNKYYQERFKKGFISKTILRN
jgi:hypothetical protein